mgnify:CR=1 FL=1
MNRDIRLSVGFFDHPKIIKLERQLGYEGVIALIRLWLWVAQNRPSGLLSGMDDEDIAIAALKSDAHYRNIAKLMNEDRARYEKEIGVLPGFKVYESVANFILIKYPIELKEALQKAFAEQSYKVKFMNEPDINTHLRITLGRPEQNRIVIDTIKEIASK